MHCPVFNHWPGLCISLLTEGGEAHERRGNLLLQVAEHSSKWDSTWLVSEGGRKIYRKVFIVVANVYIAKIVVLGAVILNRNYFVFRPCRSITLKIRLPFQVCVNIAIAPVLKTIPNALKFSCLLLFF